MRARGKINLSIADTALLRTEHPIMLINTYADTREERIYSFTVSGTLTKSEYDALLAAALEGRLQV